MAETNVSGIITADTTWTQANSPYVVTSALLVTSSVTLTIEPGVTVYLNDTYMRVDGTLCARGTPTNPISLIRNGTTQWYGLDISDDAAIQFTSKSTSWNEQTGSGSIIENAVISNTLVTHTIYINNASPKINNCTVINTGGQRSILVETGAPTISNCSITSTFAGITCTTGLTGTNVAHILDNVISGCQVGIEIYGGSPVVEKNLIINNLGNRINGCGGIRIDYDGTTPLIRNNTIVGNTVGFNLINSPSPTITFNNIQNNIEYSIYLYDGSGSDINATYNWWGTTDVSAINQSIRDKKNDFNLGVVTFVPFLTEPHPDTPTLPISVSFDYSPVPVYAYGEVNFDATASFGEYSSIANYTWNFGDGNITTTLSPTIRHVYTTPNSYNVTLAVTDEFGFTNSAATSVVVLQDDVPPVTSDNYDGLWHTADFTINLAATDSESGVAETYYRINDGAAKTVGTNGQPLITTEGANNKLEYWSADNAGNEETTKTLTGIKLDKTPPSSLIDLTGTLGNDEWFTSDVTASISATDPVSGVDRTEYSFDNSVWTAYSTPFVIADEGIHSIYYRSIDKAGNVETAKTETVKLDKTAPTSLINIAGTSANGGWFVSDVTVSLSATDPVSGVDRTEYSFDNSVWTAYSTPFTIAEEGTLSIYYRSIDKAGNVETAKTETVKVDKTAPFGSVLINENAAYTNLMSVTLTLNGNDDNSGVSQMRFSNDRTEWSTWETYSASKAWTLAVDDGTKTVYVQFKDNADLVSESIQDSIILDTIKPSAYAGQDQAVTVDTLVTFDASASSDNLGIVSYEWDFGDGVTGTGETTTNTYTNTGTYTVTLTVKDAAGNADTHQITITVKSEFLLLIIGGAAAVAITIAAVILFLWKRRK